MSWQLYLLLINLVKAFLFDQVEYGIYSCGSVFMGYFTKLVFNFCK